MDFINPMRPYVAILATAWHLQKRYNVTLSRQLVLNVSLDIHRSISLLVAPSGLECVLACYGNLCLHYAAICEPIFELHEPQ